MSSVEVSLLPGDDAILSDDECVGHENILEEELRKSISTSSESFSSVISHGVSSSKVQVTCEQLFKDIDHLPSLGMPGKLVVFGDNAWPVFSSRAAPAACMAVAQIGEGRLFMTSSHKMGKGFLKRKGVESFAILHENILEWVSRCGGRCDEVKIKELEQVEKLSDLNKETTVVFGSDMTNVLSKSAELLDFLRGGGGVVLAYSHGVFCKKNPDILEKGHQFFQEVGIGVASGKVFTGLKGTTVKWSEEVYTTLVSLHIGNWISSCCETDISKLGEIVKPLRQTLSNLPEYILNLQSQQLGKLFKRCREHIGPEDMPSPSKPLRQKSKICAVDICNVLTNLGLGFTKAPNVDQFPGDIEPSVGLEGVEVEVTPRGMGECHPTGYYLPPGGKLKIQVLNKKKLPKGWFVRIGAHSDSIYGKSMLRRWPDIVMKRTISKEREIEVFSAFGGNIYIRCPDTNVKAKLKLDNVVQSPFFDLSDPVAIANWQAVRSKAPGPWADMSGKHIRITLPSSSVRNLTDAQLVMETWDRVMLAHLELRDIDPLSHKKHWIVYDTQISKGGMHSGYPIMGHAKDAVDPLSPKFILSYERLTTTGAWGPYHELGHNMQRPMWTWEGTREVTCNIFALHAIDKVANVAVWELEKFSNEQRLSLYQNYFHKGAKYEVMKKSPALGLGFFAHLAHLFGWATYKAVFAEYETLLAKQHPRTNQAKLDQWLARFSKHAGVSIAPIMEFWGLPFSTKATNQVADLSPFLPDDKMTKLDDNRVKMILEKYPGIIREKPE